MQDPVIHIVAAVILNASGCMLLVRKKGTAFFMQPGGKTEVGESELTTLRRELKEELGCEIIPSSTHFLGRFRAVAANEPGCEVEASVYLVQVQGEIAIAAEIAEFIWQNPVQAASVPLAELTNQLLAVLQTHTECDIP